MPRRRRKVFVDANNHDRWIVSYADFITLLFAFFVVMYSISSVNEGKYKSLSHSLGNAFSNEEKLENGGNPIVQAKPVFDTDQWLPLTLPFESQIADQQATTADKQEWELTSNPLNAKSPFTDGQIKPSGQPTLLDVLTVPFEATESSNLLEAQADSGKKPGEAEKIPEPVQAEPSANIDQASLLDKLTLPFESLVSENLTSPEVEEKRELSEEILKERKRLNQVSDQLEQSLAPFINDDLIAIKRNDYWVELEMNSELLFLSGEAALSPKALPALKKIAEVINALPNALNVEGHTDNVPINNIKFPSNWDLSSARATSVVQELFNDGIDPTRLSAVGYGEFHPIGDNTTEEGRFKNRRVTLVLMSQAFSRYGANDAERAKLLNLKPTVETAPAAQP